MNINASLNDNLTLTATSAFQYTLLPVKIAFSLSSVILNIIVLVVLVLKIKNKTFSNYILISLCMSDFILSIVSFNSLTIFSTFNYWPLGKHVCLFWIIVDYSCGSIGLVNVVQLAIQRFLIIKHPFKLNEKMSRYKVSILLLTWLLIFLYWIVSVLLITSINDNFKYLDCYFTYHFSYVIISDILTYVLPVILILIFGGLTFNLIKDRKNQETGAATSKKKSKDENALICIFLVTVNEIVFFGLFVVCWPLNAYCGSCLSNSVIEISYWLAYLASYFHSIILLIFNEAIRKMAIETFRLESIFFKQK